MASPKTLELRKADLQKEIEQCQQQAAAWQARLAAAMGKVQLLDEMIAEAETPKGKK